MEFRSLVSLIVIYWYFLSRIEEEQEKTTAATVSKFRMAIKIVVNVI